jgi:dephospho-CoA kinase
MIPLLYETRAEAEFDFVVCVACTAISQEERLLDRGWNREQIRSRIEAQLPAEQKVSRADYVIWSEGYLSLIGEQWGRILNAEAIQTDARC